MQKSSSGSRGFRLGGNSVLVGGYFGWRHIQLDNIHPHTRTYSQSRRGQTKVEGSAGVGDLRSELGAGWLTGLDWPD